MTQNKTNSPSAETPVAQAASSATGRMKPTPGPWRVCGANEGRCKCGQVWSEVGDFPVATVTIGKWGDDYASMRFADNDGPGSINAKVEAYEAQLTYGEVPTDMGLANANLIAEAGTVATETGLTPRQLADQRKELLEALHLVLGCDYDSERKIGDVPAIQSVLGKVEGCQ